MIIADVTVTLPFAVIVLRPFFLCRTTRTGGRRDGRRRYALRRLRTNHPPVDPTGADHRRGPDSFLLAWGEFIFALSLTIDEDIQPITVVDE